MMRYSLANCECHLISTTPSPHLARLFPLPAQEKREPGLARRRKRERQRRRALQGSDDIRGSRPSASSAQ